MPDSIVPLPAGAAQTFADLVRERMDGPVLRYSQRTRLIREAEQRGIGRFEANLIIAAVQHQVGATRCDVEPGASRSSWIPVIVGFCATQCAIAIGVWCAVG